jgi:hypothetical protein
MHTFNLGHFPDLTRNLIETQTNYDFTGLLSDPIKYPTLVEEYMAIVEKIMALDDVNNVTAEPSVASDEIFVEPKIIESTDVEVPSPVQTSENFDDEIK